MEFSEQITQFSERIKRIKDNINTEEATKTSIILPFFQILGYDVFNPLEFVPEFTADAGIKKGEKVDYAILSNREPLILIEAKSANTELATKHMNQLLRYFMVTKARFGILTNGIKYKFFSDLEETNKMDSVPFFEFNLLDLKKDKIEELKQFHKDNFNLRNILNNASDLKYMSLVKESIEKQFQEPSDQLVKAIIKNIYPGTKTQAVLDKFREIVKSAINEYTNDTIATRISSVISPEADTSSQSKEAVLSVEEIETMNYIKNMFNTNINITYKKTSRYTYMQIGEYHNKWICRVFFQKNRNMLSLRKFEDTDYECEYYFDDLEQLNGIKELIKDTFEKCVSFMR
ncbi:MAG: endonuclease [Dorea sp.]|jgi:hypothetical protein|nr:endonuclease [Dorea sp.]